MAGTVDVPASRPGAESFDIEYQIFDPLTTRPDPQRPGRVIRTPFPGNIIPADRFMNADGTYKNPSFGLYQAMVPAPPNKSSSAASWQMK